MAADLFVSYARKDRERVVPWIRRLQAQGISVWVDEQAIEGATRWAGEISQAIDECKVVLLMLSASSAASEHVMREVFLALDGKKPLLPLYLEAVTVPASLRYALAGIQHLDLSTGENDEKLQAILRALSHHDIHPSSAAPGGEPDAAGRSPEDDPPVEPAPAAAPSEAPAAPVAHAAPAPAAGNLPRALTSFIGREREIAEVKQLLTTSRLVSLIGAGGSGKTRLALHVAEDLLPRYPDGAWLVEMEAINAPSLVAQTVASALGVREEPGRSLMDELAGFLRARSLLLVLDNCEHLVAPCAQLAETLLRACPNLSMLATSREPLGVRGEALQRVPSLSLPNRKMLQASGPELLAAVSRCEAVQLFIERAGAASASFALTEKNALSVAQVCRRLDGIPLALELAAARVKVLSVEQIGQRLDDRFRLLTGGSRTALPRHQTLRATIDWSYELLGEPERALLRRLAIFAGGWELAAAEAVCGGEEIEEWEVLDYLTQLVDKSLVNVEAQATGEVRYSLLETVHQYSLDKLKEGGEMDAVRPRHAAFFRALSEEAQPMLIGSEQSGWLERLENEHENLRAALEWLFEEQKADEAAAMSVALGEFWWQRGWIREGRDALARCLALESEIADAGHRASLLGAAGWGAQLQADYDQAMEYQQRSLDLCRELGDAEGEANALNNLALIAHAQGHLSEAKTLFESSLEMARALGDEQRQAGRLSNLGLLAIQLGNHDEARERLTEAQAIFDRCHDINGRAGCLCNLAELALRRQEWDEADRLSRQSLELFRQLEERTGIAYTLANLAEAAVNRTEYAAAERWLREALSICVESGMRGLIPALLEIRARVQAACGAAEPGMFCLAAAQRLRDELSAPRSDEEQQAMDAVEIDLVEILGPEIADAVRDRVTRLTGEAILQEALQQESPCAELSAAAS